MRNRLEEIDNVQNVVKNGFTSEETAFKFELKEICLSEEHVGYMDDCATQIVEHAEVAITSLKIAEQTGKEHKNVMRDIRNMFKELHRGEPKSEPSSEEPIDTYFEHVSDKFKGTYLNSQNKNMPMYILPEREAMILASGYSVTLRASIIDELARMKKKAVPQVQFLDFTNPAIAAREYGKLSMKYADALEEKDDALSEIAIATSLAKQADESSIREFVKDLAIDRFGLKTCFTWLREHRYMMKNGEPYQKWVNKGYFTMKPWKEDKDEIAHFQLMFTELGKRELGDMIRKEFSEPEKTKDAKGGTL